MTVRLVQLGVVLIAGALAASIVGRPTATAATPTPIVTTIPIELYDAESVIRAIVPSIISYDTAHSGFTGMTIARLRAAYGTAVPTAGVWVSTHDPGLPAGVSEFAPTRTEYCVIARVGVWYAWKRGEAAIIQSGKRPAPVCRW